MATMWSDGEESGRGKRDAEELVLLQITKSYVQAQKILTAVVVEKFWPLSSTTVSTTVLSTQGSKYPKFQTLLMMMIVGFSGTTHTLLSTTGFNRCYQWVHDTALKGNSLSAAQIRDHVQTMCPSPVVNYEQVSTFLKMVMLYLFCFFHCCPVVFTHSIRYLMCCVTHHTVLVSSHVITYPLHFVPTIYRRYMGLCKLDAVVTFKYLHATRCGCCVILERDQGIHQSSDSLGIVPRKLASLPSR